MFKEFLEWLFGKRKPKEEQCHHTVMICEGKELCLMKECNFGVFMPHEKEAYERLVKAIDENDIVLYCSISAWDNFLNRIALTGKTDMFKERMLEYVNDNPSEVYILCENGQRIFKAVKAAE